MSTNPLNGTVGEPAHFAGDYLFKDAAMPNSNTITSEAQTLNNALGRLQLTGTIDANLSLEATKSLSVTLQYKDGETWKNLVTVYSVTGAETIPAGQLFAYIPVPDEVRRICRLQVTADFDASAVKLTTAIEILP